MTDFAEKQRVIFTDPFERDRRRVVTITKIAEPLTTGTVPVRVRLSRMRSEWVPVQCLEPISG